MRDDGYLMTRDLTAGRTAPLAAGAERPGDESVRVNDVWRAFGEREALRGVSLVVEAGEIHALLGPNGAGKTTLMRVLTGMLSPDRGSVEVMGMRAERLVSRGYRRLFGLVPSGDRTFYLRLSGLENLRFFGRLHGMSKRDATERAMTLLAMVGLDDVARAPVNTYSHGMQKRLSVARGMFADPPVLIIDEPTHDLDPENAERVRDLIRAVAHERATAVLWATQRLEEIRGFADRVTLLHRGEVKVTSSVPSFLAAVPDTSYLVHIRAADGSAPTAAACLVVLGPAATVDEAGDEPGHVVVTPVTGSTLGDALAPLLAAGYDVLGVREERPGVERAFLWFTREDGP